MTVILKTSQRDKEMQKNLDYLQGGFRGIKEMTVAGLGNSVGSPVSATNRDTQFALMQGICLPEQGVPQQDEQADSDSGLRMRDCSTKNLGSTLQFHGKRFRMVTLPKISSFN
ncbi:hypothetical protein Tco_0492595 [Tanacetum coccineum]